MASAGCTKESGAASIWRRPPRSLTTLLYGSELWVTWRHHLQFLERFHQSCLRTVLNIHWSEFITKVEVLEQVEITSIEVMFLKSQLRWAEHVSRMDDYYLSKISLHSEIFTGHIVTGTRDMFLKSWRVVTGKVLRSFTRTAVTCRIDHHQWSILAAARPDTVTFIGLSSPLRIFIELPWRTNDSGGRTVEHHQQCTQTRPSTAATAAGLACSASAS